MLMHVVVLRSHYLYTSLINRQLLSLKPITFSHHQHNLITSKLSYKSSVRMFQSHNTTNFGWFVTIFTNINRVITSICRRHMSRIKWRTRRLSMLLSLSLSISTISEAGRFKSRFFL